MSYCTPSRTSKRLSIKKKKEGPAAVSAVKKFKLDIGNVAYSTKKSEVTEKRPRGRPRKNRETTEVCEKSISKDDTNQSQRKLQVKPLEQHHNNSVETGSGLDEWQVVQDGPLNDDIPSKLVTAFNGTLDDRNAQGIYADCGAVINQGVVTDLDTYNPQWRSRVADQCSVRLKEVEQTLVVLGEPEELLSAKQSVQQMLDEVQEVRRAELEKQQEKEPEEMETENDQAVDNQEVPEEPQQESKESPPRQRCRVKKERSEEADFVPVPESSDEGSSVLEEKPRKRKTPAKRHRCDLCLGKFISKAALENHEKHHKDQSHGDMPAVPTDVNELSGLENFYVVLDGNGVEDENVVLGDNAIEDGNDVAQSVSSEGQTVTGDGENQLPIAGVDAENIPKSTESILLQEDSNGKSADHIPETVPSEKEKQILLAWTCEICQLLFISKKKYQSHFRGHFDKEGNVISLAKDVKAETTQNGSEDVGESGDMPNEVSGPGDVKCEDLSSQTGAIVDMMVSALLDPSQEESADIPGVEAGENKLPNGSESSTPMENGSLENGDNLSSAPESSQLESCEFCGYQCSSELLPIHKARVHVKKNFCCPLCKRKMATLEEFQFHYLQHFDREGKIREEFLVVKIQPEERHELEKLWSENPKILPQVVISKAERLLTFENEAEKISNRIKCKFCTFTCKTENAIKSHILRHFKSESETFSCDKCDLQFGSKRALSKHIGARHQEDVGDLIVKIDPSLPSSWDQFLLPKAQTSFSVSSKPDDEEGIVEIEDKGKGLSASCDLCGFRGSASSLFRHKQHDHSDQIFTCQYCPKQFSTNSDVKSHIKCYHLDSEGKLRPDRMVLEGNASLDPKKDHMCRVCGHRGTQSAVKYHVKNIHKPEGFQCEQCEESFPSKVALNKHRRTHLTVKEMDESIEKRKRFKKGRLWMCHLCPYSTPHSETDLKEHILRKHEPPKHKCKYCGKMFGVIYDLRDHINHMHLRTKQVVCDLCGQSMFYKNLKLHKQRIHDNYRPFKCDACGMCFSEKRLLERHKGRHQPKESRPSTVFCEICNKAYASVKTLADHMNKHRGVKPYQCDKCGAKFGIRSIFLRHLKNHERGMLQCPYTGCSYQAVREKAMSGHLVKRHKDMSEPSLVRSAPTAAVPVESEDVAVDTNQMLVTEGQNFLVQHTEGDNTELLQVELEETLEEAGEEALLTVAEDDDDSTRIYMCSVCQQVFSSLEHTQEHMLLAHNSHVADTVDTELIPDQVAMDTNQAVFTIATISNLEQLQVEEADLAGILQQ